MSFIPKIFKRNVAAKARSGRNETPDLQFVTVPESNRWVALGLTWRTIMLTGEQSAINMARQAGATHYCALAGHVVGYGRAASKKVGGLEQITPAALLAARHHQGDAAFLLKLDDGRIWAVESRNARPTGKEAIFDTMTEAQNWLIAKLSLNTMISVYSDVELSNVGLNQVERRDFKLKDLLEMSAHTGDQLFEVPPQGLLASIKIPSGAQKILVVLLVGLVAKTSYEYWDETVLASQRAEEAARLAQIEDPHKLWTAAIEQIGTGRSGLTEQGLKMLRQTLGNLPVDWKGWQLKTANCKAQSTTAKTQAWNCVAFYESSGKVATATNAELKRSVPEGFTVQFVPTKNVTLLKSLTLDASVIDLPDRSYHLLTTASKLQELVPAMTEAPTLAFSPLGVVAPRKADGTAILMPADMQVPTEATITLRGPLRTIDAMIERGVVAQWRSISLVYGVMPATAVTLNTSALQVELSGVLYAKN